MERASDAIYSWPSYMGARNMSQRRESLKWTSLVPLLFALLLLGAALLYTDIPAGVQAQDLGTCVYANSECQGNNCQWNPITGIGHPWAFIWYHCWTLGGTYYPLLIAGDCCWSA